MKRVLITGIAGLLGSNLALYFKEKAELFGILNRNKISIPNVSLFNCDIQNKDKITGILWNIRPDIIIHCAAETNVDYCEENRRQAYRLNAIATKYLANYSKMSSCKLIYLSTDSIYRGDRGYYLETEKPEPGNVYAKTKLTGERSVQENAHDYLIFRTNIYGWNVLPKLSLAEWVIDRIGSGKEKVPGFVDIVFSPILVNDFAEVIEKMINSGLSGTYNIGARDSCSKYEFARMICRLFGKDENIIRKASIKEFAFKAPRPENTSLNVDKISGILGVESMPTVELGLIKFKKLKETGYLANLKNLAA